MRRVRYVGPYREVEIEVAPERWRRVKRGSLIEVGDQIAERLVVQEVWEDGDGRPAPDPEPGRSVAEGGVPGGTIAEVMDWVTDGDEDRALAALEAERNGKGRKKLLGLLEQLVDGASAADVNDGAERLEEDNTDG